MDLLDRTLGNDSSNMAEATRASCIASLPDAEVKQKVWEQIIDPDSPDSPIVKKAKMQGFYSAEQQDIVKPYIDRYFEVLPDLYRSSDPQDFQQFFHTMLPRIDVTSDHIVQLLSIQRVTPDNDETFSEMLRDGLDLLMGTHEIRKLA